jgi:hypothetical protein
VEELVEEGGSSCGFYVGFTGSDCYDSVECWEHIWLGNVVAGLISVARFL